jgi:hypothetical protein
MPTKKKPPPQPPPVDEDAGVFNDVQAWYLGLGERDGVVYTWVLRQLMERLFRDRDYQAKRERQGVHTSYDWALERDQKALAWALRALVRWVPDAVKEEPEPPRPPRKPARRLPVDAPPTARAAPLRESKRDWAGPELPPG